MKIKNKALNEKSKKWLKRHLDDEFVKKSTSLNYRSRAVYKLLEIIDKFNLLHNVEKVLDLGSAPGSWSLIISEKLRAFSTISFDRRKSDVLFPDRFGEISDKIKSNAPNSFIFV